MKTIEFPNSHLVNGCDIDKAIELFVDFIQASGNYTDRFSMTFNDITIVTKNKKDLLFKSMFRNQLKKQWEKNNKNTEIIEFPHSHLFVGTHIDKAIGLFVEFIQKHRYTEDKNALFKMQFNDIVLNYKIDEKTIYSEDMAKDILFNYQEISTKKRLDYINSDKYKNYQIELNARIKNCQAIIDDEINNFTVNHGDVSAENQNKKTILDDAIFALAIVENSDLIGVNLDKNKFIKMLENRGHKTGQCLNLKQDTYKNDDIIFAKYVIGQAMECAGCCPGIAQQWLKDSIERLKK